MRHLGARLSVLWRELSSHGLHVKYLCLSCMSLLSRRWSFSTSLHSHICTFTPYLIVIFFNLLYTSTCNVASLCVLQVSMVLARLLSISRLWSYSSTNPLGLPRILPWLVKELSTTLADCLLKERYKTDVFYFSVGKITIVTHWAKTHHFRKKKFL